MVNPLGRPVTPVAPKHVQLLTQLGIAKRRTAEADARASRDLDKAIAKAYLDGVPVMRIADLANTTRDTVRKALRRQGIEPGRRT